MSFTDTNSSSSNTNNQGTPVDMIGSFADGVDTYVKKAIKGMSDADIEIAFKNLTKRMGGVADVTDLLTALKSDNPKYEITKALTKMFGSKAAVAAAGAIGGTVAAGASPLVFAITIIGAAGVASYYGSEYIGDYFDYLFKDGGVFDNYTRPFYTISDETEYEGETMVFKLRFKETPKSSVIINFKTIGYTATENDDFEYKNETLTISPDDIKNGVYEYKVKIHNDSEFDKGKEYFILRTELMNKENFPNLVQDFYIEEDVPFIVQGQGNILEKETVYITIEDKTLQEGDESCYLDKIAVTLSRALKDNETISVNFSNQILVS